MFWVYVRYYSSNYQHFFGKLRTAGTQVSVTGPTGLVVGVFTPGNLNGEWAVVIRTGGTDTILTMDRSIPLPLHRWSLIGVTYDAVGNVLKAYQDGSQVGQATVSGTLDYDTVTPGNWFTGALPTGSTNPEEGFFNISDVRIGNLIRPQSYYENIYATGYLPNSPPKKHYFILGAYDPMCVPIRLVVWTSTTVDYTSAPTSPCGGTLENLQILNDYWA